MFLSPMATLFMSRNICSQCKEQFDKLLNGEVEDFILCDCCFAEWQEEK